jgi:hypothetical protein
MSARSVTTSMIILIFVMILVLGGTASAAPTGIGVSTFDQCSNDTGTGFPSSDSDPGCHWINGDLNKNNSLYQEGDATVQRLWMTGFTPGQTYSVTFSYGTTKGGKHAYDFLTSWDWSEDWIASADLCQDITGCTSASSMQYDIPVDPNAMGYDTGVRQFLARGGTISSVSTPTIFSGDYTGDSETHITVNFTVDSSGSMCSGGTCGVAIIFGAHVAAEANWGTGMGAGSIPGSPYHVSLYSEGHQESCTAGVATLRLPADQHHHHHADLPAGR